MAKLKKTTDIAEFILKWSTIVFFVLAISVGWAFFGESNLLSRLPASVSTVIGYVLLVMFYTAPFAGILMLASLAFLIIDLFIDKFLRVLQLRSNTQDDDMSHR
jgi:hypothetical protein